MEVRVGRGDVLGDVGSASNQGFQTLRESSTGGWGLSKDGYPVSLGGTVIRPPPLPPPKATFLPPQDLALDIYHSPYPVSASASEIPASSIPHERPEEPAKYISEVPKLPAMDISSSAVACGNWLAQLRQVLAGLSPSAVEQAAAKHYQRWLIADPLDRLSLDPSGVIAIFDEHTYQRVESRAVTLILAAIPSHIRDEAVSDRWLSTAALLFRLQCLYQPGGSTERSMLLSQLTIPETVTSLKRAVTMLRRWQQQFHRIRELQASMPDPSLLLAGVDKATSGLLGNHHALAFRVNAFRHRVALDYNPTVPTVVQLVRLIQAECEAASLGQDSQVPDKKARAAAAKAEDPPIPSPPKAPQQTRNEDTSSSPAVKAMEGDDKKGKGKGKGKSGDVNPCHSFNDGKGCKFGDACRFKHDRAQARKQKRCLACGQDGHFRPECPLVAPENRQVLSDGSNPTSPKASATASSGPSKPKSSPQAQAKGVIEDGASLVSGTDSAALPGGSSKAQEALLAEAAKLLKGVSIKHISISHDAGSLDILDELGIDKGWLLSAVASASDPRFALVDSGATNALRPADAGELQHAHEIRVDLASGVANLHVNRHGTLLSKAPCQVIIPAAYLVKLGFALSWSRRGCTIKRRGKKPLEVTVVKGCPLISRDVGLQLLRECEDREERGSLGALKVPMVWPNSKVSKGNLRSWLASKVAALWLCSAFPQVPQEILQRVVGETTDWDHLQASLTPWNRRKRRSISRAKPGEVLVHLFAGQQRWRVNGPIVEVEKSRGSDLLDPHVWQHLLMWAVQGVIGGVVGGPPCRSVSRCRSEEDGGPPPVRGRGEHRWGLPGRLAELVLEDSVLWLRFVFLYAVAQAAADGSGDSGKESCDFPAEEDWLPTPPSNLTDPLELAKWALQQAAVNLDRKSNASEQVRHDRPGLSTPRKVFFGWEHPTDPQEYADPSKGPQYGYPSWWSFEEWDLLKELYSFHVSTFDQGKLGHERPKPTSFASNSWLLYEVLQNQFLTKEERDCFPCGPSDTDHRLKVSKGWASWAPGLAQAVRQAWDQWRQEQSAPEEILQRQILLKAMTAEQRHQCHLRNDHVPFQKGCPVCVAAQGRQRSHRRQAVTGVYGASFDIAGPFVPEQGFDAVSSGRDLGHGYKYFLACAYSIPISLNARPSSPCKKPPDSEEPQGSQDCVVPEESLDAFLKDDMDQTDGLEPLSSELLDDVSMYSPDELPASMSKVTHRYRVKGPESPNEEQVQTKTMFLGVPLRTKKAQEVTPAVQTVICRLETAGYPVDRYFADRAQELRSSGLAAWLRSYGVYASWTAGEDPASNKAELAVQYLKAATRKLLKASNLSPAFWPLAVLHASRRSWINVSLAFGSFQPTLLPFGLPVHAKRRYKIGAGSAWQDRTIRGLYMGQAPDTAGGHLVLVPDGKLQHVLLTNTIFPIATKSDVQEPPKPRFRLRSKSSPHFELRPVVAVAIATVSAHSWLGPVAAATGGEWDCVEICCETESSLFQDSVEDFEPGVEAFGWGEGGDDNWNACEDSNVENKKVQGSQEVKEFQELVASGGNTESETAKLLETCLTKEDFSFSMCYQVLQECVEGFPAPRRRFLEGDKTYAVLGYYCHGGLRGVTRFAQRHVALTRYLNRFVAHHNPTGTWTTLYVSRNTGRHLHRDYGNDRNSNSWVVAVGDFQGGGLWVERGEPPGPVLRKLPDGSFRSGVVLDIHDNPQLFDCLGWHESEPWIGIARWVIVAYTPKDFHKIDSAAISLLEDLFGFRSPPYGCVGSFRYSTRIERIGVYGDLACCPGVRGEDFGP